LGLVRFGQCLRRPGENKLQAKAGLGGEAATRYETWSSYDTPG
jgi:hypothetical protein